MNMCQQGTLLEYRLSMFTHVVILLVETQMNMNTAQVNIDFLCSFVLLLLFVETQMNMNVARVYIGFLCSFMLLLLPVETQMNMNTTRV